MICLQILLFLTVCTLIYGKCILFCITINYLIKHNLICYTTGEFEENVHIDDSKFGPLEPPNSPKNASSLSQVTDFTDILAISNAIKSFQVKWFSFCIVMNIINVKIMNV